MPAESTQTKQETATTNSKFMSFLFNEPLWSLLTVVCGALLGGVAIWSWVLTKRDSDASAIELERFKKQAATDITAANKRVAEAEIQVAQASVTAATAQKEAALARAESERLKVQAAWRSIPESSGTKVVDRLSARPGIAILAYTANDPEALNLAIQLSKLFSAAKWQTVPDARAYPGTLYFGIVVPNTGTAMATDVREAFAAGGIVFSGEAVPEPPVSMNKVVFSVPTVLVMVGSKKPPF